MRDFEVNEGNSDSKTCKLLKKGIVLEVGCGIIKV